MMQGRTIGSGNVHTKAQKVAETAFLQATVDKREEVRAKPLTKSEQYLADHLINNRAREIFEFIVAYRNEHGKYAMRGNLEHLVKLSNGLATLR
jgi:hypothetical protein